MTTAKAAQQSFNSRGTSRQTALREALSSNRANKRFVFSTPPPLGFIAKHFGVPVPSPIGSRWIDGKLETKYDRIRDRPL
ncbi:MAG: hypothetical protein E2598_10435 [Sphingobium sp.]|nr:hypothetical protein [Sphingobium sp.]